MILDASVAVKLFLEESGTEDALRLGARPDLIAPDIVISETMDAIWKARRLGHATEETYRSATTLLPSVFSRLVSAQFLIARAADIAIDLDHPIYDCLYLALAEAEQFVLVTADVRLLKKIAKTAHAERARTLLTP